MPDDDCQTIEEHSAEEYNNLHSLGVQLCDYFMPEGCEVLSDPNDDFLAKFGKGLFEYLAPNNDITDPPTSEGNTKKQPLSTNTKGKQPPQFSDNNDNFERFAAIVASQNFLAGCLEKEKMLPPPTEKQFVDFVNKKTNPAKKPR